MKALVWVASRTSFAVGALLVGLAMTAGCGEKPVEKPAQDVEQARQEHIKVMQREMGQGGGAQNQ